MQSLSYRSAVHYDVYHAQCRVEPKAGREAAMFTSPLNRVTTDVTCEEILFVSLIFHLHRIARPVSFGRKLPRHLRFHTSSNKPSRDGRLLISRQSTETRRWPSAAASPGKWAVDIAPPTNSPLALISWSLAAHWPPVTPTRPAKLAHEIWGI